MSKPIQIYAMAKQDRSDRVRWLLEELNAPYEDHFLKKSAGEMQSPQYLKLNPMGRVPTIVDGDTVVYESGAVCLYLADKFIEKGLAPKLDSAERAAYLQWMVFSVGSLEAVVARMFTFAGKTDSQVAEIKTQVQEQCTILKLALNSVLQKQDYLLASGFSAADIMMAAVIPGAAEYLMEDGSAIKKYMDRLMKRPAAVKAEVFN
ncbi:MAG: glutathione S-transferase family protein [Bdellovibrio sp.]|nr:glutathione S-transferase family protein [Bdellovibrio sp.]